ncbi:MAG: SapC family protein, partial [Sphingomicrobium sp.]
MQISPPFGYSEVVPFLKTQKVRLLGPGEVAPFARSGNAVPISHTEFQPVARHYPIVFTAGGDGGANFAAVAVLGLSAGENLFYAGERWEAGAYIPAYARRYPFCMAKVNVNRVEQKDRLICVEKSALDDAGEAMFDAAGKPSDKWKGVERLLAEY